ncbi:hypothetical protein [Peribacillus tepidiphilus]|uniref:hypothetical protein n=1 Tax=Peribacillus tepidiphilus TaxID=2652445 RepID=UPI0012916AC7|nr:hypothetical protein [Peribacillus tepidiphilus]
MLNINNETIPFLQVKETADCCYSLRYCLEENEEMNIKVKNSGILFVLLFDFREQATDLMTNKKKGEMKYIIEVISDFIS